jgi:hypothetical protein
VHSEIEDMESHLATAHLKRATIKIIVVIKYVQLRIKKSIEGIRHKGNTFFFLGMVVEWSTKCRKAICQHMVISDAATGTVKCGI